MSENYWETQESGLKFLRCGECRKIKLVSYEEGDGPPSVERLGFGPQHMCRCTKGGHVDHG